MDTAPRTEWNGLPGYLAAERLPGPEAAVFNGLDLGFNAETARQFLKEPIGAIEGKIRNAKPDDPPRKGMKPEELLTTLVLRFGTVLVMAERERAAEERRHRERQDQPK